MSATPTEDETGASGPALSVAGLSPLARLRAIVGGSAGNLVEWYDWFAYSSFALYFAPAFFPKGDQTAQLLQTAAIFAVGFLARPVGAWLMGIYADRAGRRTALAVAVFMMCLGSLIIALTPTYAQIGSWAPLILLVARIIQGLSVGGEYGASATYLSEVAGKKSRGFWSSFHMVTLLGGQLIALCVLIILQRMMTADALNAWGWRIPFFIGAALAVLVFWIRIGLHESSSYENAKSAERATTRLLFLKYPKETLITAALTMSGSLSFYCFTTYMQKFLVNTSGFSKSAATEIMAAALIFYMIALPLLGAVSDRLGRKPVLIWSFAMMAVVAMPVMVLLGGTQSPLIAFGLLCVAIFALAGYGSVAAIFKAELFPANVRALGVALPYALANSLFGGTAEYVALWFKQTGSAPGFYIYVAAMALIACIVCVQMRETQTHSTIIED